MKSTAALFCFSTATLGATLGATLTATLTATSTWAALPSFQDSAKQIQALIESREVEEALGDAISSVVYTGRLTYRVKTARCHAVVQLNAQESDPSGATVYSVKQVATVVCPVPQ